MRQITDLQNPSMPMWSPNGRQILFNATMSTNTAQNDGVFVMNADGLNDSQALTSADEECLWPRWSPDGKLVVFIKRDAEYQYHLFVMNADGTDQTEINPQDTLTDGYYNAVWLADGNHILYETVGGLFSVTLNGSKTQKVATSSELIEPPLALSPDETFAAFSNPSGEMFALKLDGSDLLIDLGRGHSPSWSS